METSRAAPDPEEAIVALLVCGPAPSAFMQYLDIPGVCASMGPTASASDNRVGLAHVPDDAADALVERVIETYRAAGRGMRWYVSRLSRPADLARRLEERGLVPGEALVGMALDGAAIDATAASGAAGDRARRTTVRAVHVRELRGHAHLLWEGFGTTEAAARATLDMLAAGALPGCEFVQYLAFDGETPVGYATTMIDRRRRVALLGGSAVLPRHRGRGHYRELVLERVADARRRGSEAVVVQARRGTSAPILARLGFREVIDVVAHDLEAPTVRS